MESTSPIYHPSFAKNYINVTNNLNPDDTYVWYDSQNPGSIMFPSVFTYKKTSSWNGNLNLRLNSVSLNSASGSISNTNPTLPATEGSFNATLQLQNSSAPTMDLYFTGNIQKNSIQIFPRHDYDVPVPTTVYMPTPSFNFYSNTGVFPTNSVQVLWSRGSGSVSFSPSTFHSNTTGGTYTYRYTGDKISFTTNWNSDYRDSNLTAPSEPLSLNGPSVDVSVIPTVYCNWEIIWDYPCTCLIDCSTFCQTDGGGCGTDGGGGGYIPWDTTHYTGYYGYIRYSPSFEAAVVAVRPMSDEVTVTQKSGDWYYVTFKSVQEGSPTSGWCYATGLDTSKDPNSGGGGCSADGCPSDSGCSDYCSHICNHECSGYSCTGYIYCSQHS